jgi:hypothetical protein
MSDLFWKNLPGQTWINVFDQKWIGVVVAEPSKGEVIDLGLSRLAYQFKDSENFNSFIESFLSEYQELYESELQLLNERYLDTAIGVQLDGIGEIVGLPRPEEAADVAGVFGFLNDPTSLGFTTLSTPSVGGNFISIFASKTPINDELYRLLLRAKVIENRIAMTVEETLELISFMFGGVAVEYTVPTAFEPNYKIHKVLSSFEDSLLDNLPIMLGIGTVTFTSL